MFRRLNELLDLPHDQDIRHQELRHYAEGNEMARRQESEV
ncbi:MAG: hypothetical protein JWO03_1125 [Bacteroidetes bacterium]|nr:hypothetical protein [Bacteroidota bacterium]